MPSFKRFPGSWRWVGAADEERIAQAAQQVFSALRHLVRPGVPGSLRFGWEDDGSMLVEIKETTHPRMALRPADLTALRLDGDGHVVDVFALHGRTARDLVGWSGAGSQGSSDDVFDAFDRPALGDVARLINNADDLLTTVASPGLLDPEYGTLSAETATGRRIGLQLPSDDSTAAKWYAEGEVNLRVVRLDATAAAQADDAADFFGLNDGAGT